MPSQPKNQDHWAKRNALAAAGTPTTQSETMQEIYQRLNAASTQNLTEDRKKAIELAQIG